MGCKAVNLLLGGSYLQPDHAEAITNLRTACLSRPLSDEPNYGSTCEDDDRDDVLRDNAQELLDLQLALLTCKMQVNKGKANIQILELTLNKTLTGIDQR